MYKSIHISKQLSYDKITFISLCCKYAVVWSRPETIAVADDVWKEVREHMVISVPHSPKHCLQDLSNLPLKQFTIVVSIVATQERT